jgi:3-deoxy-D-manno-octulosonic-acid transferase
MGLNQRSIQTIFISVILRKEHFILKSYAGLFLSELRKVSKIFVQDENSKKLLDQQNFSNVVLSGDTRFDRVYALSKQEFKDEIVVAFKGHTQLIIAGSTWEKDEELLKLAFSKLNQQNLKLVIAPHLVDAKHISKMLELFKEFRVAKYTHATTSNVVNCNVLIIDCIGKLMNMYAYGDVAYIGGGFGAGIHNTLEPAAFGLPVIFGPKFQKFNEAKQLLALKSAFSITNEMELFNSLEHCMDEKNNEVLREINSKFVIIEKGATKQIVEFMMLTF